ncbi:hypothetical protein HELRODRAFT_184126 [Helobdella robusta]|uniref:Uncharacterized protein n=1 Tax=Helobdella robusta TaxID=6412 RepID=T1FKM6_HELRO|nr:hypothetical protein HELRODRAFT_184126 [Helobdella robusta]ESO07456.1 hypothetical protein HELRODRAFT_184126 [Helobdella robusta]
MVRWERARKGWDCGYDSVTQLLQHRDTTVAQLLMTPLCVPNPMLLRICYLCPILTRTSKIIVNISAQSLNKGVVSQYIEVEKYFMLRATIATASSVPGSPHIRTIRLW